MDEKTMDLIYTNKSKGLRTQIGEYTYDVDEYGDVLCCLTSEVESGGCWEIVVASC